MLMFSCRFLNGPQEVSIKTKTKTTPQANSKSHQKQMRDHEVLTTWWTTASNEPHLSERLPLASWRKVFERSAAKQIPTFWIFRRSHGRAIMMPATLFTHVRIKPKTKTTLPQIKAKTSVPSPFPEISATRSSSSFKPFQTNPRRFRTSQKKETYTSGEWRTQIVNCLRSNTPKE